MRTLVTFFCLTSIGLAATLQERVDRAMPGDTIRKISSAASWEM